MPNRWANIAGALTWGYRQIVAVSYYFTLGLVLFMAVSIAFSVLMRRVFESPIGWIVEGSQYMLVYIAFLAAARILQQNGHARMTLLVERLRPRAVAGLNSFASLAAVGVCIVIIWYTGNETIDAFRANEIYTGNILIARWLTLWVIPFGFLLMLVQFINATIINLRLLWTPEPRTEERTSGGSGFA